jgi:hypothetical protein
MNPPSPDQSAHGAASAGPMKRASILDEAGGGFILEYDDTVGRQHTMRLEARTYDAAILEARSFLGSRKDDRDAAGDLWMVE